MPTRRVMIPLRMMIARRMESDGRGDQHVLDWKTKGVAGVVLAGLGVVLSVLWFLDTAMGWFGNSMYSGKPFDASIR